MGELRSAMPSENVLTDVDIFPDRSKFAVPTTVPDR